MNKLNILFEDNHIIVVEKPFNIPSQEDSSKDIDMLSIIKNYIKEKYNKSGNVYLGLVHRLDRPVSGVMVFARTSKAAKRLSDDIKNNRFHKSYITIVHGKLNKDKDRLVNKLTKNAKTNTSYIDNINGKESILEYEVLKYDKEKDLSFLKINLITGRHHQIRVQLSSIGNPIYGDQRYGYEDKKQIALYAYNLKFYHPVKKELMEFKYFPKEDDVWKMIEEVKEML